MTVTTTATAEVVVDATPDRAFSIFTDEIALWWRRDSPYWTDPERARSLRIEPRVGGRFVEVHDEDSGEGFEIGRVTEWEPGRRLGLTWTLPDWPDDVMTDVEVTFTPSDEGTHVRLEHRGFDRIPGGVEFVSGFDEGWAELLGCFAARASQAGAQR